MTSKDKNNKELIKNLENRTDETVMVLDRALQNRRLVAFRRNLKRYIKS